MRSSRVAAAVAAVALGSIGAPAAQPQGEPDPVSSADDTPIDASAAEAPAPAAGTAPADATARRAWLVDALDRALAARPRLAAARVGVDIIDLATGERLWSRDPDGRYNLASTTKVLTGAAALATLGPGYRWRTDLLIEPGAFDPSAGTIDGDLYVRGRGDPTLTTDDLSDLARDLRVLGVRRITGGLVLDATIFDGADEPPHFDEQPLERAGFRAPTGALSLERNATVIVVEPRPGGGGAARVRLDPVTPALVRLVRAEVLTIVDGRTRVRVGVERRGEVLEVSVTGQIRADDGPFYTRRRIDTPGPVAIDALERALADEGIRIGQRTFAAGAVPLGARVLASHDSDDLATVVRAMNKVSDNFLAESILRTLGAEARDAPGATWADGQAAVAAYLAGCGVPASQARVSNGSGLFGSTDVSPAQLVTVLRCALRDFRVGPELLVSLPIGGVDGTLRRRLQAEAVRGRVRAKTGTLATVTTLAGVAGVDGGRLAAFAILVNDAVGVARTEARSLQDDLAATLVAWSAP